MKADAIAIKSRIKNKMIDNIGKGFNLGFPNFYAIFLSFIIDATVLTAKVVNSFIIFGFSAVPANNKGDILDAI